MFEIRPEFFLLVDLREFFFQIQDLGDGKKKKNKSSENDQSTGHFQIFFLFFFNISRKNNNSKTCQVNFNL